jgi:hypothetical protein
VASWHNWHTALQNSNVIPISGQHPTPETSSPLAVFLTPPSSAFCNRPLHTRSPSIALQHPSTVDPLSKSRNLVFPSRSHCTATTQPRYHKLPSARYNNQPRRSPTTSHTSETDCCYPNSFISLNWPSRLNTEPPPCPPRQIRRMRKAISLETSISQSSVWEQNILHTCSIRNV